MPLTTEDERKLKRLVGKNLQNNDLIRSLCPHLYFSQIFTAKDVETVTNENSNLLSIKFFELYCKKTPADQGLQPMIDALEECQLTDVADNLKNEQALQQPQEATNSRLDSEIVLPTSNSTIWDTSPLDSAIAAVPMRHPDIVRDDVTRALRSFPDLNHPSAISVEYPDKSHKLALSLTGTVPINYKGSVYIYIVYNIPLCINLFDNYPYIWPFCYVRPSPGMKIKPSKSVDEQGRIYLPYLSVWQHPKSDLDALLQIMVITFQDTCPVFSIPTFSNPTQVNQPYPSAAGSVIATYPSCSSQVTSQEAIYKLTSKAVSTVFVNEVDPADLLPHLVPWFITRGDSNKFQARLTQTGHKQSVASDVLDEIVQRFENKTDISLQDVIDALKKTEKYENVIKAMVY